jgi:hypothetical protein
MLTPGNRKLGGRTVWSFSLPAGPSCPGATPTCLAHCYAAALERYRPRAAAAYRRNLALAGRPGFARRLHAAVVAAGARVVRAHVAGDFHTARYARAWLQVMRRLPGVRFYFYTRSWRVAAIRPALDAMAGLPNCRAWYSADRDTGVPADLPPGARVAWLMADAADRPPAGAGLVFRVRRLRRHPPPAGVPVCPAEDGRPRPRPVTCDRCGTCWRPAPGRVSLPTVRPPGTADDRTPGPPPTSGGRAGR